MVEMFSILVFSLERDIILIPMYVVR